MSSDNNRLVVDFARADPRDVALLGGKGAGLAEMSALGISVPPGFVISTDVCHKFLSEGSLDEEVSALISTHLGGIEQALGRTFGDEAAPLLISVRSGAPVSMPGMMDTVLNLGLTDATLAGLARMTGNERFAQDCYVRLLRSYGTTVRGIDGTEFDAIAGHGGGRADLTELRRLTGAYLCLIERCSGRAFPQDPHVQLQEAIGAVFSSWNSARAIRYRKYAGIADTLGSAVVVQAMVFGNLGANSGTGVAFTRDPATGAQQPYGDFLADAQGEDVVAGEHDVQSLVDCLAIAPEAYHDLHRAMATVETKRRDMCEVEFTIENGRLWMLQTRVGQRTATAAIRIALDLLEQGVIDISEAIGRITPNALSHLSDLILDPDAPRILIGKGTAACPGAAVGRVALSSAAADEMTAAGIAPILVRPFTSPADVGGMIASCGVVTARGGRTSHAAVVARGMNRPAVCGVEELEVEHDVARFGSTVVREGDAISLDGGTGEIYLGSVPVRSPAVDHRIETLLRHCDHHRVLPLLSQGSKQAWADSAFDPATPRCAEIEDVERYLTAGAEEVLLDVGASANPKGLLTTAASMAAESGIRLIVLASHVWPPSIPALPPGPWAGIAATEAGVNIARLVTASAKRPDS